MRASRPETAVLAATFSWKATFTAICGRMRGSSWSKPTRTRTVDFWRSAVGMIAMTLQGIFQSGYASSVASTGWPAVTRLM